MPLGRLAQVLRSVNRPGDARLLVGPDTLDDAGVVRIPNADPTAPALVQTVDFFPPVVDDPYYYGAVAAANALSDVYAMGGQPLCALTIAGFPKDFDEGTIGEIMRGGFEKVAEAGAVVAGGHTVESDVQFGFAVTGLVDPAAVTANTGAAAGDRVYLTKPVGMGTMTTAAKRQVIDWPTMLPAAVQMATLNAAAAQAMVSAGARAATDVTGFGLMGHGRNLARGSGATLRLWPASIPVFPGALELARQGIASGGSKRGQSTLADEVSVGADVDPALVTICFDSETSGGLLIAIAPERAADLERELAARGVPVVEVGEFVASTGRLVELG
ncbi:selenide, water dikinase SelD [Engelhardtia mirabilis]|uniref:Selenide, water dikinase n=1 Tax=Engelhardtia mirabilis TaxID=2528011 RepID=A0A518BIG8_9BACT|nr:Selenide, water dikinase [Planctomycetes bacterium Pla133]QDV01091.1 Selenide, water dikinase [Planctomycetes bacterium Pla86]